MQEHRTEHRSCTWLTANRLLANAIFLAILQRHADIGSKVLGTTISVTTTVIATARNDCRETASNIRPAWRRHNAQHPRLLDSILVSKQSSPRSLPHRYRQEVFRQTISGSLLTPWLNNSLLSQINTTFNKTIIQSNLELRSSIWNQKT